MFGQAVSQVHHDGENHGGGADHGGPNQHRLGCRLEGIAGAVVFFQQMFGALKVHVKAEVFLDLLLHVRDLLDQRQLVN